MRWEDERWVKSYTRDTIGWLNLSFEAQGLFQLLMRKVDRAGIARLDKYGKRGVAALIGHASRWTTIEPALAELVDDGCIVFEDHTLVIPNFIAAQEASASDAERQRAKRERDRDKALAGIAGKNVTPDVTQARHAEASRRGVTHDGHAGDVTPRETSQSRETREKQKHVPLSGNASTAPPGELLSPAPKEKTPDLPLQVFEHWRKVMGKGPRAQFDAKLRSVVEKALKRFKVADLCKAIDGCKTSSFHQGANERGRKYEKLSLICRDAEHVQEFIELAEAAAGSRAGQPPWQAKGYASELDWLEHKYRLHNELPLPLPLPDGWQNDPALRSSAGTSTESTT